MEADLNQQIDNMEGLAAHAGKDGETIITMISDDNFNTAAAADAAAAVRAPTPAAWRRLRRGKCALAY